MSGAGGSDRFFSDAMHGSVLTSQDQILDFLVNSAAGAALAERIGVSALDAKAGVAGSDAFAFIVGAAFSVKSQIREAQQGADVLVEFNTTGASGAEMAIMLKTFTLANLMAADFVL